MYSNEAEKDNWNIYEIFKENNPLMSIFQDIPALEALTFKTLD